MLIILSLCFFPIELISWYKIFTTILRFQTSCVFHNISTLFTQFWALLEHNFYWLLNAVWNLTGWKCGCSLAISRRMRDIFICHMRSRCWGSILCCVVAKITVCRRQILLFCVWWCGEVCAVWWRCSRIYSSVIPNYRLLIKTLNYIINNIYIYIYIYNFYLKIEFQNQILCSKMNRLKRELNTA